MQTTPVKIGNLKNNEKTPEKLCMNENVKSEKIKNDLTILKNQNNTCKSESPVIDKDNKESEKKTPQKNTENDSENNVRKKDLTPLKSQSITLEFRPPDVAENSIESDKKTPQKNTKEDSMKYEQLALKDGESDGLISTTEQARILIAASKTPVKSMNKTPNKQSTPTGKRSIEQSPKTPGKYRRVELITLASPKAKKLKEM